ncbi:Holliday junction branch migration protein RuvA [Kocuria rhizophila]|uniref:Holliday junction branch migration complex subunit RuvA n=1 Tax=Kocuria rhizophila TaxID=72000 RepID=A0AAX2SF64_KOCRH|nr:MULTISPECIES: Holliday junction branch migration protein RuvA [Kocuria]WIW68470.1 Holliday junction branch migration protein RuvA [Kocuria sp. ChxB]KIC69515.1 ATP-dependent DNA helicase RuvA [Kocuria rhizophila]KUP26531.1 ATP-dependent DNA helicase RuvA [Kocuria rhizophila]MCR4524794.1 Holliday junction branch migration protein RuvA [Kocuria rhizophila]MCT1546544.1 Holliday junction branch migration protein RuvA [Kocuria rhizophila]
MIASVTGEVAFVGATLAVVEVSGFGIEVHASPHTLSGLRVGATTRLHTAYIARKDEAPLLFGFAQADEKEIFSVMLGVSGVGPRTALAAVSVLGPDDARRAIAAGDDKAFTAVPGIGPKSARRIVLELADKLVLPEPPAQQAAQPQMPVWRDQVVDALTGLGWNEKDAVRGIEDALQTQPELGDSGNVAEILRAVLSWLGTSKGTTHAPTGRR